MNTKYIIVILGEPYSTFSEIIGKYFRNRKKLKKKVVLIGSKKLLLDQLKNLNCLFKLNEISNVHEAQKNIVNIIDVKFDFKKIYSQETFKSNDYIKSCFKLSLEILKRISAFLLTDQLQKTFLNKKYLGITEYLAKKTMVKNEVMLIYNSKLSVSPLTTHIPIKNVAKKITKSKIINNVLKINDFYLNFFKKKIKIAVLGLNPHCETTDTFSEEDKIIKPSIKYLKDKGTDVEGPFSADSFFLKKNINKFDVVVGMYHDQVLGPMKTIFNFNAINITIGLPFIRISPDHGPNKDMLGKNKSDPSSFFYAMEFIKKINK